MIATHIALKRNSPLHPRISSNLYKHGYRHECGAHLYSWYITLLLRRMKGRVYSVKVVGPEAKTMVLIRISEDNCT